MKVLNELQKKSGKLDLKQSIRYQKSGVQERKISGQVAPGTPLEVVCNEAAGKVCTAIMEMYYLHHVSDFYFSVLFSFTQLVGSWATVTWPGILKVSEYHSGMHTVNWDKMRNDVSSTLTYKAVETAQSYEMDAGSISEYVLGVHGIQKVLGSCDSRQHTRYHNYVNDFGGSLTAKIISPKSKGGNCAINCLLLFYKRHCKNDPELSQPAIPQMMAKSIRKKMSWLKDGEGMAEKEVTWLGDFLKMNVTVMNSSFGIMYITSEGYKRSVSLILIEGHFWLMEESPQIKVVKRRCKKCDKCGQYKQTVRHKCPLATRKRCRRVYEDDGAHDDVESHAFYEGVRKLDSHWLVYGPAGTGKSYIIRKLRLKLKYWGFEKRSVFLSTTGVSALEIQGQTLNSYFQLGCMNLAPQVLIDRILGNEKKYNEIRKLKVIIIDEVSMLNVHVFYFLDRMLRVICQCNKTFGGIRLVLFGDFMQLPPIENGERFRYIFEMELWQVLQREGLEVINLKKGWRYPRVAWFKLLKRFRDNSFCLDDIDVLKKRIFTKMELSHILFERGLTPTYIFGRKSKVKALNKKKLNDLDGVTFFYPHLDKRGVVVEGRRLRRMEYEIGHGALQVKLGAQVMLTINSYKEEFKVANGSVGKVLSCEEKNIVVKFKSGNVKINYYTSDEGVFMPLILSWAITSHKCQGKTLECIITELSMNQVWSASQAYVVLSRCVRLENVFLSKFDVECITVNPRAYAFTKWCELWPRSRYWRRTASCNLLGNGLFSEVEKIRDTTHSCLTVQPKSAYKGMLYRNILFYDFETMDDEQNHKEVPYFNHLKHYKDGLLCSQTTICKVCTPAVNVQKKSYDFLMGLVVESANKYNVEKLSRGHSSEKPLYVCAYNGSGFDFHFIMQELIRNAEHSERFHTMTTMKGTKIVYMSLWDRRGQRVCMICHDMLNITCSTLKSAAKSFLGGKLEKEVFPHLWVTPENLKIATENKTVSLTPEDFPTSMREGLEAKINFPFHKKLHEYGPNDVVILEGLYGKMEEISQEILGTSILRFNTLSKMTWYGFLMNLGNEFLAMTKHGFRKRRTLIYRMTREEDMLCSRSIYGAKVYPRIMKYISCDWDKPYSQIKDYYVLLDIVSMYVKCMRDFQYPYGLHELFTEHSDEIKTLNNRLNNPVETWDPRLPQNKFFICEADLECHPLEVEPPLGMKTKISGKGFKATHTLHWENTRRTGWYTNIDIFLCLRNEGKVHKIKRAFIWPKRGDIFKNWISLTFDGKKAAKKAGQKAKEKFFKTVGNGCYGSSLQRMFDDVIVHVKNYEELAHFHEGYEWLTTVNFEEVARNEHSMLIMKGRAHVNEKFEWTNRPRFLGSFVLAWSRLLYDDIYDLINPWRREGSRRSIINQILYGDTDSFFVHCSAIPRLKKILGTACGMVGDDLNDAWAKTGFAKIVRFNGPGPKSYALRAVMPESMREEVVCGGKQKSVNEYEWKGTVYNVSLNQMTREVVKIKGIARSGYKYIFNGDLYEQLTYDMIEAILESDESVTIVMEGRLMRNGLNLTRKAKMQNTTVYNICRRDLKRTLFKTKFSRRYMAEIHPYTVPHGFDLRKLASIKELV